MMVEDALKDGGSTAGQIGVGWGWYMVSPTFGAIFPSDNRPDAYDAQKRLKVVILMTDGEFNTPYCNGVVAGAVLGFAKALGEFGATITFVSAIPGETLTIASAVYGLMQVPGGEAAIWRLAAVSLALSFGALLLSDWLVRRQRGDVAD